jgi:hypothetical protein
MARRIGANKRHVKQFLQERGIERLVRPQTGANNPKWRGGRQVDKDGYVLILRTDHPHRSRHGYVREHRLVMEAHLGRLLEPTEIVHHKDGNRQNNALENLEVFGSNGAHLATSLRGRVPRWTPAGKARLRATGFQPARGPRTPSPGP